jgi:hypothetical protein
VDYVAMYNMSLDDARCVLRKLRDGQHVHPVLVTVALVVTGDLEPNLVEETYEENVCEERM